MYGKRATSTAADQSAGISTLPSITAVPRPAHVYIGRLCKGTECELVKDHIIHNTQAKEVQVEKIVIKRLDSDSFQIIVNHEHLSAVKHTSLWPVGTVINRYFFARNFPKIPVLHPQK